MILPDTNILVHAVNLDAAQHEVCRAVVEAGFHGDLPLILVPQVLVEAFAILGDPRRVEHPLSPVEAWSQVEAYRAGLPVLDVGGKALDALATVVGTPLPVAQDIFDAALVAQMRAHGVATLCTYDTGNFQGYPGISVETPEVLLKRYRLRRARRHER